MSLQVFYLSWGLLQVQGRQGGRVVERKDDKSVEEASKGEGETGVEEGSKEGWTKRVLKGEKEGRERRKEHTSGIGVLIVFAGC
jgi:hypothetical protein